MPKTYGNVTNDVESLIDSVMKKHHRELADAGVNVRAWFAYAPTDKHGVPTSPAITKNGLRCAVTIRRTNLLERVQKLPDAVMLIDGDHWEKWPKKLQTSLIDHELTHLALKKHQGAVCKDDIGRPKLEWVDHDWHLTGFWSIAKRYKLDSFDFHELNAVAAEVAESTQLQFDFTGGKQDAA